MVKPCIDARRDTSAMQSDGVNQKSSQSILDIGDGCKGARVTLWKEDENKRSARFFVVPSDTPLSVDDSSLRASVAQRLYGQDAASSLILLTVDGVELDDARYLRDGDRVVVQL